jgi:hypothetical protein
MILLGLVIGAGISLLFLGRAVNNWRQQERLLDFTWTPDTVIYSDKKDPVSGQLRPSILAANPLNTPTNLDLAPVVMRWPIVFSHMRKLPGLAQRLVEDSLLPRDSTTPGGEEMNFFITTLQPVPIPKMIIDSARTTAVSSPWIYVPGAGNGITLYGGQADLNDSRHFTIAYRCSGRAGIIDGWLEADDSVKLEPRQ